MRCVVETSCANAHIVEDLTVNAASDECTYLKLETFWGGKNVRPTEREGVISFAMLNVQINIFFSYSCASM